LVKAFQRYKQKYALASHFLDHPVGTGKQKLFVAVVKYMSALFYCLIRNCQTPVKNRMLQQKTW